MTAQQSLLPQPSGVREREAGAAETDHASRGAPSWTLMHGRWQDCLDVECDMWCADAPYSARAHAGHDATAGLGGREDLGYAFMSPAMVREAVDFWEPRTRGWFCTITDHTLFPIWEHRLVDRGRYVFAPIPVIDVGMTVRFQGDGPSCWTAWLLVARRKTKAASKWRTTRGEYMRSPGDEKSKRKGGKPMNTMRAIIRDYSDPGDLVCDPYAGECMTLRAALAEGRSAVGSEVDAGTFAAGRALLERGYTQDLFARVPPGSETPNEELPAAPGWSP